MRLAHASPLARIVPQMNFARTVRIMTPRWLFILVIIAAHITQALAAEDTSSAPRPLAMSGAGLEAVNHALIELTQGDTSAIEALALEAFLDPVARPDLLSEGLYRRWTMALPAALARLNATERAHALTRLNARYQALAANQSDDQQRARLASAFLPAPSAITDLGRAADRAFDLGMLSDFLGLEALLVAGGTTLRDPRRQPIAVLLSGLGPQVDAPLRLPPPGNALPSSGAAVVPNGTLATRWKVIPGWILACDPFDQIIWQYRIDRMAKVTSGPGAVLVHDHFGLRALDDRGLITPLRPLPSGALILSIAGGCAWFATGELGWRVDLHGGVTQSLALQAPPLGAPLVRGQQSLWLTHRELLLFAEDHLVHRFEHGLPATTNWKLAAEHDRPAIVSADGKQWRLESFADQFARLSGNERAELLLQASRPQDALALLGEPRDPRSKHLALRAHLKIGVKQVANLGEVAFTLCESQQDRALVVLAHIAAMSTTHDHTLRQLIEVRPALTPVSLLLALDDLAKAQPSIQFTDQSSDLGHDLTWWNHACSGTAWLRWRRQPGPPQPPTDGPLVIMDAVTMTTTAPSTIAMRRADGAIIVDDLALRLERGLDAITVTCHDHAGLFLWRQRWRSASLLTAPSQTIDVRDGVVQVLEGGLRMTAFDLNLGVQIGTFIVDDLGSGTTYVLGKKLALVGPLGVDNSVTVIDELGVMNHYPLPSPARWIVPLGHRLLIRGQDGIARLYPENRVMTLPAPLITSRIAPQVSADGLSLGSLLWRWAR